MDNKKIKLNISNNNSNVKFSNFYLLFSNMKESKKLLQSYKKFIEEYLQSINGYYKQLTELNCHFLVEDKFKSSLINTPIFQLGKAIKKAVEVQINNLFSLITEEKLIDGFNKSVQNLSKILGETSLSPLKNNQKSYGKNIEIIASSLIESYSEIESRVIDDYISKKYNKHLIGLNNDTLEDNIVKAQFLERTFLQFEETSKNQFFEELNKMENKTNKIFNEIIEYVNNIINFLKNNGTGYLDILQKEVNTIWKLESNSDNFEDISKKKNINIEDKNKLNNLNHFKYKIKIIEQPYVRVEDENNNPNNETLKENEIENNFNRTKTESTIFDDNDFFLEEEDIYSIISTLYSFDLSLINKSEYNLEKEKRKIRTVKLSKKLLMFGDKNEIITKEEINELYQLIEDKENLVKFFVIFNNYRTAGEYELEEKVVDILKIIFSKCQDYLVLKRDKQLEGFIIILSQTFYIKKNDKKIYLNEFIKEHKLFKKKEFWENHLNELINEDLMRFERDTKNMLEITPDIKERKIREIIITKLIPFTSYMKDLGGTKEMILSIIYPIMDKYNFDENSKNISLTLLE